MLFGESICTKLVCLENVLEPCNMFPLLLFKLSAQISNYVSQLFILFNQSLLSREVFIGALLNRLSGLSKSILKTFSVGLGLL